MICTQYFESDDPELYTSKVQYIRENDVSDLELVFAEEEFSDDGTAEVSGGHSHTHTHTHTHTHIHTHTYTHTHNLEVVPLVEGGEEKMVTEENKTHYLNLLAQHRLATQCRSEVEHFMKGKSFKEVHLRQLGLCLGGCVCAVCVLCV